MGEEKLIETMARKIAPKAWDTLGGLHDTMAQENRRKASLKHARAALAAAREAGWGLVRDVEDDLQSRERMLHGLGMVRK